MQEEIKAADDVVTGLLTINHKSEYGFSISMQFHQSCAVFSENKDHKIPFSIAESGLLEPKGQQPSGKLSYLKCNKCGKEYLIIEKTAGNDNKKEDARRFIQDWRKRGEELVKELYWLTEEEIKIVEGK